MLEEVNDPEVPVLSVVDLGIVREVRAGGDEIEIIITPTYSGCPAMDVIRMNIRMKLLERGYPNLRLTTVLSPAWTTDWMSERGKEKLREYGIAPPLPLQQVCHPALFQREEATKSTSVLSGGEAARLLFCKLMLQKPNVLVLDEPTNHLDLESINALNIALQRYQGTVFLVTHDHDLIDEVATRIWHFESDHKITDFKGTYEDYQAATVAV